MKKQNFNDEMLRNEAFQIFNDFELLESFKISKNIIHLIYNDIIHNMETTEDEKTTEKLSQIIIELDEIIKKYN